MASKPTIQTVTSQAQNNAFQVNKATDQLADAIVPLLPKDGSEALTGDLSLNGYRIIDSGAPKSLTDLARLADIPAGIEGSGVAQLRVDLASTDNGYGVDLVGNGASIAYVDSSISNLEETSIANLRAITYTPKDGQLVDLLGYYTPGDGGGGQFYWDATSTATDNNGTIIKVTAITTGRWIRLRDAGIVHIDWFGFLNDGSDESTLLNQVLNYFDNVTFIFPEGKSYKYGTQILVSDKEKLILEFNGSSFHDLGKLVTTTTGDKIGNVGFELRNIDDLTIRNLDLYAAAINTSGLATNYLDVESTLTAYGLNGSDRGKRCEISGVRTFNINGLSFNFPWTTTHPMSDGLRHSFVQVTDYEKVEIFNCEVMPESGYTEMFAVGDSSDVHVHDIRAIHGSVQGASTYTYWSLINLIRCDTQVTERIQTSSWTTGSIINASAQGIATFRDIFGDTPDSGGLIDCGNEYEYQNIDQGEIVIEASVRTTAERVSQQVSATIEANSKKIERMTVRNGSVIDAKICEEFYSYGSQILEPDNYTFIGANDEFESSPGTKAKFEKLNLESVNGFSNLVTSFGLYWITDKGELLIEDSTIDMHYWEAAIGVGYTRIKSTLCSRFNKRTGDPTAAETPEDIIVFRNCTIKNDFFNIWTNVRFENCIIENCIFDALTVTPQTTLTTSKIGTISFDDCDFIYDDSVTLPSSIINIGSGYFLENFNIRNCTFNGEVIDTGFSNINAAGYIDNMDVCGNKQKLSRFSAVDTYLREVVFLSLNSWKNAAQLNVSNNQALVLNAAGSDLTTLGAGITVTFQTPYGTDFDRITINNNVAQDVLGAVAGTGTALNSYVTVTNNTTKRIAVDATEWNASDLFIVSGNSGPLAP